FKQLYESQTNWSPVVGNLLTDKIAGLYRDGLKNPTKAHEIYDWGLQKSATDPARVILLEGKATTLLRENRGAEAETLLAGQWPQLVEAARASHPHLVIYAARTLQQYSAALEQQGKTAEVPPLLQKALQEMPVFLDARRQVASDWSQGWMFEKLVTSLLSLKRPEEALSWAKLSYMLCAFDKAAVERATSLLGRVWGQMDDLAATRAFAVAQADATKPNPLAKVPLPDIQSTALQSRVARLRSPTGQAVERDKAPELITLLLATSAFGDAMVVARQYFLEKIEEPRGAQEVCRVFKAGDLNTIRANAFLAYLEGNAPNPMKDFFTEHPPTAPGSAAPAAPAAPAPAPEGKPATEAKTE
ncbi:MAG: hypothetical protein M3347_08540, partial [Armatimonadota bacterium]|nr:hypothetical protein [Armatimonadota bacterium]